MLSHGSLVGIHICSVPVQGVPGSVGKVGPKGRQVKMQGTIHCTYNPSGVTA